MVFLGLHALNPCLMCQIEDLLNEVKFSEYVDTGKYVSSLELGVFIRCK